MSKYRQFSIVSMTTKCNQINSDALLLFYYSLKIKLILKV